MLGPPPALPAARLPALAAAALALTFAVACSAVVNPDPGRLGSPSATDAGRTDAGIIIGIDAGPDSDAGPRRDAGTGPCSIEAYCEGSVAVSCAPNGAVQRTDCGAQGASCLAGRCVGTPPGCTPGTRRCDASQTRVLECGEDGTEFAAAQCEAGQCVAEASTAFCQGDPPADCADLETLRVGSSPEVDLCDEDDERTYVSGMGCNSDQRADTGDVVFALEIERTGRYVLQLDDSDNVRSIDTVLYLRNDCDRDESQLSCADDTPCSDTFPNPFSDCVQGIDYGRSRIVVDLEPGTYYVVLDAFDTRHHDRNWRCGSVTLAISEADRD